MYDLREGECRWLHCHTPCCTENIEVHLRYLLALWLRMNEVSRYRMKVGRSDGLVEKVGFVEVDAGVLDEDGLYVGVMVEVVMGNVNVFAQVSLALVRGNFDVSHIFHHEQHGIVHRWDVYGVEEVAYLEYVL